MQSGVHEILVGFRFVHGHVFLTFPLLTCKLIEVNPSSISLLVNPSNSMQIGVHESLVDFQFVHVHVFLVPSHNL